MQIIAQKSETNENKKSREENSDRTSGWIDTMP
jgi:hypothetical protein